MTGRTFERFTLSQRVEHGVQILTFSTLVVTGCAQKFNTHASAEAVIYALGGIERVRAIHRFAAIVLIAEAIYHAGVVVHALLIRRRKTFMLPNLRDGRDALHMLLYFIGVRKERARFDRFDFRQKSEYWALVWGSVVMITTGLVMWFPVKVAAILPGQIIPAARAAHSGEGLLAFLAILIWHMYSAHLAPEVFPIDTTIFTGKISEERMIHEHPLEYERITRAELEKAEADAAAARASENDGPTSAPEPEVIEEQAAASSDDAGGEMNQEVV